MKSCPYCNTKFTLLQRWIGRDAEHVMACTHKAEWLARETAEQRRYTPVAVSTMPRSAIPEGKLPPLPRFTPDRHVETRTYDQDFTTGLIVGATTGNPMLGMLCGGSLSGSLVGSALHDSPATEPTITAGGGDFGGGGASGSWEPSSDSSSCDTSSCDCGSPD